MVHTTIIQISIYGNSIKDSRNKELKHKAQELRAISSNNHFGNMKISKNSCKKKNKNYLREKQGKKKESKSTLATGDYMTNSNYINENKIKTLVKSFATTIVKITIFPRNVPNLKMIQKQ